MRRALAPLALSVWLIACDGGSQQVPWTVRTADPAVREQVVRFETSIRRGGCEGVLVYRETISADMPGPAPMLGRGLHGFAAEARDAECRVIARGCIERDLPLEQGERLELVLERVVPISACAVSACAGGTCTDVDAGQIEHDAGTTDAGTPIDDDASLGPDDDGGMPSNDASILVAEDAGRECDGQTWAEHCYVHRAETRDWPSAEASCVAWGGHLTTLGGPEEEAFVRGLAGGRAYWIGLHELDAEDVYTWIDGSSASYRHWAGGEPSTNAQFHCTRDEPSAGWQLRRCREVNAFVCER